MSTRALFIPLCFLLSASSVLTSCNQVASSKSQAISATNQCKTVNLPNAPKLTGRLNDGADALQGPSEDRLAKRLDTIEKNTGVQAVIVTLPTLNGIEIADYGCNLGKLWGVGDKYRNDGLLILYAIKERQVRIDVGIGLESRLSNDFLGEVISVEMVPQLSIGRIEEATNAALDRIESKLAQAIPPGN